MISGGGSFLGSIFLRFPCVLAIVEMGEHKFGEHLDWGYIPVPQHVSEHWWGPSWIIEKREQTDDLG